ncbi:MAG: ABC transporter ATP-binding protein [Thermoguttaceae bacterium]|jgi:ABC-type lipoprotein export system ATPase subunit
MLLEVHDLTKQFAGAAGTVRALDGVSLSLDAGQFLAVQGASGCGKTTLLLVVGGLLRPKSGEVVVGGQAPYRLGPEARARFRAANVGFVFQQFHLIPYLDVLDNILAAALAVDCRAVESRARALELATHFGLGDRMHHVPAELSTGERQRTALARALLNRPKLLLADEVTGNLDAENGRLVLSYLDEFTQGGGAVLLVTHDAAAAQYAQRVIHMEKGKPRETGS